MEFNNEVKFELSENLFQVSSSNKFQSLLKGKLIKTVLKLLNISLNIFLFIFLRINLSVIK